MKRCLHCFVNIKMMLSLLCFGLLITSCCASSYSKKVADINVRRQMLANGVGMTPPMGWSSWIHFGCEINETIIRETADALVSTGLAKLGYQYVNIDDCWAEKTRDDKENLVASNSSFPSGIKDLADYVHNKGLKFGLFSNAGFTTCSQSMPDSPNSEEQDANTFASWGIDFLKYCDCHDDGSEPTVRSCNLLFDMRMYIRGSLELPTWAAQEANSSRTTDSITTSEWKNMIYRADRNEVSAIVARPGAWNDPDFVAVGDGYMTNDEDIVHFSLWAISKAPLLLANDIRDLSEETLKIIANEEVIAVNQDPLGVQAKKVVRNVDTEVWAGHLSGSRTVVLLLNRGNATTNITAYWDDIDIPTNTSVEVRDLWQHQTKDTPALGSLTAVVYSHACKLYVFFA